MGIMSFFSKLKKRERGVLLVDALIGITVLAIGLVALLQLFTYGTKSRADASLREKAVYIATERIEMLKAKESSGATAENISDAITAINANTGNIPELDNEKFTATLKMVTIVSDTDKPKGDENIRLVNSQVTWKAPDGKDDSVTLYTYVIVEQDYQEQL